MNFQANEIFFLYTSKKETLRLAYLAALNIRNLQ